MIVSISWGPVFVALLMALPVFTACKIDMTKKQWGNLSPLRLHQISGLEKLFLPASLGSLLGVSAFFGALSLLGNAYPSVESRWITIASIVIYLFALYLMISINRTLIINATTFIQKSRRHQGGECLRENDLQEIFRKNDRYLKDVHATSKEENAPKVLLPRRTFASEYLEETKSKQTLVETLSGGTAALRTLSIYRFVFLVICVAMPAFLFVASLGSLNYGTNDFAFEKLYQAIDETLEIIFRGSTDNIFGIQEITKSPFFILARFGFFYFLAFVPLRYASLLFQYRTLGWRTQGSGLGLEIDAMSKLSSFFIILAATLVSLLVLKVDFSSLGLLLGLVAGGMSIAMRDTLGNLMAGMQLIWDRSLKKGDVITISTPESNDTGSTYGIVEQIRMRYTVIQDRNTVRRLIPNHLLTANPIEHWTHEDDKVRLSMRIGVSYDAGNRLREVQKIMESVCYDVPRVLTKKAPQALLVEYGDSAIVFSLRFWLDDARAGIRPVVSDVLINLYERLDDAEIKIPFPQRDLHIRTLPQSGSDLPVTTGTLLKGNNPSGGSHSEVMIEGSDNRSIPA